MILYEGGELWPELASCHFSFPSGQSIVTVLQRDGICWRGKRVNTAAMMTQHNCLAMDYLVLAVPCIPAQRAAISHNQESEWSGHRRVERQGGGGNTATLSSAVIQPSTPPTSLLAWLTGQMHVNVLSEERRRQRIWINWLNLPLLLFQTTDWLLFYLQSMRYDDVWQRVSGQDVSEQWAARRAEVRRGGGGGMLLVTAGCCWLLGRSKNPCSPRCPDLGRWKLWAVAAPAPLARHGGDGWWCSEWRD